jgi:hypothetical protein
MFAETRSLLQGKLSISGVGLDHVTPVGVDGLHYSQYGVLMPVSWIPFDAALAGGGGDRPAFSSEYVARNLPPVSSTWRLRLASSHTWSWSGVGAASPG